MCIWTNNPIRLLIKRKVLFFFLGGGGLEGGLVACEPTTLSDHYPKMGRGLCGGLNEAREERN